MPVFVRASRRAKSYTRNLPSKSKLLDNSYKRLQYQIKDVSGINNRAARVLLHTIRTAKLSPFARRKKIRYINEYLGR